MTGSLESTEGWLVARSPKKDDQQLRDHKKADVRRKRYDWQEDIKKLQTSPNYRKGHHLNSQWQSQIAEKIGIATKIGIAKMLGLPEEQPEVSETPNIRLELPKPRTKPPN